MNLRRVVLAVGAIAVVAGVIALCVPVSVQDSNGQSIGCGTAIASDLTGARNANEKNLANLPIINQIVPHTDYVASCESALSHRRAWTLPLTAVGALVAIGSFWVRPQAGTPINSG
jgi:hypothetical protein